MLRAWCNELALRHFGRPFPGTVRWAPRLRYRAGDYRPAGTVLRLSLPYFQRYGPAEAQRILLHELCHWWLYSRGIVHREDARVFQTLLAEHGAPARARPMPRAPAAGTVPHVCPRCHARYRLRRGRPRACGRCCRLFAGGRFDARFLLVAAPVRSRQRH